MPIKLHAFGEAWGLADASPFCLKLMSFLRECEIAYEVEPFDFRRSFRRAPKGKIPYIEDENGTLIGDSSLIIARLSQRRGINLDAPLDDRQRGIALAMRRMMDEHLYWIGVYARWIDEPGFSITRDTLFASVPASLRWLIAIPARRRVRRALHQHGVGRHQRDEIYALGAADLQALSRLLGEDVFFFGLDKPSLVDLWAHAFLAEIIIPPLESPLKQTALGMNNLVGHCQRIQDRLYSRQG
ncbi:MAG: glutathione S-transferase family protein [Rhodospirillales bacterium]|nr:glutathione S-transferase family protein [Rhodospirillales bacterium]